MSKIIQISTAQISANGGVHIFVLRDDGRIFRTAFGTDGSFAGRWEEVDTDFLEGDPNATGPLPEIKR